MDTIAFDSDFNVRQMQAYAALCLRGFCKHVGIEHQAVNELILHLLRILTARSLPEWEQQGSAIAVSGRGDPLPDNVLASIPPDKLRCFTTLVESCVEVGIVDMYGASTGEPKRYLDKCIEILNRNGVALPDSEVLRESAGGADQWRRAMSEADFEGILEALRVDVP